MAARHDGGHDGLAAACLDAMPELVVRYRVADRAIRYCNAAWSDAVGRCRDDLVGRCLEDFLDPRGLAGLRHQIGMLNPDRPILADAEPRPMPGRPGRLVEWVDQLCVGPDGCEILAVGRDVTERHAAERRLAESEARFRDLADKSADVVFSFSLTPTPHFDYISPAIEQIIGYTSAAVQEDFTLLFQMVHPDDRAVIEAALTGAPLPDAYDLRFVHPDGRIVTGEIRVTRFRNRVQGVGRDVTEVRRLQAELAAMALRDPLTGLANRRLLDELLDAALQRTQRAGAPLVVAYLDLDQFKDINDSYGHDAGDAVLVEVARRLTGSVRASDIVARVGGDEFVIVHDADHDVVDALITRLESAMTAPIEIGNGVAVRCTTSIGAVSAATVGHDAGQLVAAADRAMYEHKRSRRHQLRGERIAY